MGRIDLTGQKFGRLTAKSLAGVNNHRQSMWTCICDCGKVKVVSSNRLRVGGTKSCGCSKLKLLTVFKRARPYEGAYNKLRRRASQRNYPVDLTYEEYVEFTKIPECQYCHKNLAWCEFNTKNDSQAHNLDRKDNAKGYSKENCIPCCGRCNNGKGRLFTHEQWYRIMEPFRTGELT